MSNTYKVSALICFFCILATNIAAEIDTSEKGCISNTHDKKFFIALKTNDYKNSTKYTDDELLTLYSNCLGNQDPELRDSIAYDGIVYLLRAGRISNKAKHKLLKHYYFILRTQQPEQQGFLKPFTALALAEVARTDRVKTFLSSSERSELVSQASRYIESINDYRGFTDVEGWRHGVAHASDVLMQLSLNKNITQDDIVLMMQSIAYQVRQHHSAYVFGEPSRLARPILFLAASNRLTNEQWNKYFQKIGQPQPLMEDWNEMYNNRSGLIQHHNIKAFLSELYLNATLSNNENIKNLKPHIIAVLKVLI